MAPKVAPTEDSRLVNSNQISKNKDPQLFYSIFAGIHYYWHLQGIIRAKEAERGIRRDHKDMTDEEFYEKEVKNKRRGRK